MNSATSRYSMRCIIRLSLLVGCALLLACSPLVVSTQAAVGVSSGVRELTRHTHLELPAQGKTGFESVPAERTGVFFTNALGLERSLTNHILMNGSGVACGDVNGDGRCDVYLCGIDGDNALYLNQGDWHFTNNAAAAGVACSGYDCTGTALADIDGDGDLDLLVATIGRGVMCFRNDGTGKFQEITDEAGLRSNAGSMGFGLADADGDGDLDLYVVNYRSSTLRDNFNVRLKVGTIGTNRAIVSVNGRSTSEPDLVGRFTLLEGGGFVENGEADHYYQNDGKGHFSLIPFTSGAFRDEADRPLKEVPYDWGLSVLFRDLNGDGWPDLYVCNDLQSPDRIWINRGDGTFRALSTLGVRQTSWFSMGVDVADLNRDGWDDFFVADMLSRDHLHRHTQDNAKRSIPQRFGATEERLQVPRSTLFIGRGESEWAEIAWFAGLAATDWSWAPVFLDVDLDGYEDLLITTGFERDVQDMDVAMEIDAIRQQRRMSDPEALALRKRFPPLAQPNLAFRNRGDLTFEEVGSRWGFDWKGVSQGIALADLDGDGDLDVVINNLNGPALFLRNTTTAPRVAVRLIGKGGNTAAIGARIRLMGGGLPQQQEMVRGGRYLSSDDALRTFAFLATNTSATLEVRWRNGAISRVENVLLNQLYTISEAEHSVAATKADLLKPKPLFENVTQQLNHVHREVPFDDFERQPLLSRTLSQLGPGVTWFDLDGDGWEDLWVGTGRSGTPGVLLNNRMGGFTPLECPKLASTPDDTVTTLGFSGSDGSRQLLVGIANYESTSTNAPSAFVIKPSVVGRTLQIQPVAALPFLPDSPGALAMADLNLDGRLDLFVGGRVLPGHYPAASSSRVYLGTTQGFALDEARSGALQKVGLVTSATFADLNGDGRDDLVVATEWGPIRVFLNQEGQLLEATAPLGLEALRGWWNGIATGDFDGDGTLDLVASNWGRNHRAAATGASVFFGDFDSNGTFDLIEAYSAGGLGGSLPWMTFDRLGEALPFLRTRFRTYGEYGRATVAEILGAEGQGAMQLSTTTFDSTLFLNRQGRFTPIPLPAPAQWTVGFSPVVADFDGDGFTDLFLSQNFSESEPHLDRLNAGTGLLMLGDGKGQLRSLSSEESGIKIYGSQRGAASADYDRDGRMDLVVAQNAGTTYLFHNRIARRALRVQLRLNASGREAIGATLRPVYATGQLGPATELHLGEGYWSQATSILLLGAREQITSVWIRWPGGKTSLSKIPPKAESVLIDDSGLVQEIEGTLPHL